MTNQNERDEKDRKDALEYGMAFIQRHVGDDRIPAGFSFETGFVQGVLHERKRAEKLVDALDSIRTTAFLSSSAADRDIYKAADIALKEYEAAMANGNRNEN